MRKTIKEKFFISIIYALIMSVFNIIKMKNNIDFVDLIGDCFVYFVAFLVAQYLTDILFDV